MHHCAPGDPGGGCASIQGGLAAVRPSLLQDNVRDKLHPIVLSMNYSLVEQPRSFQLGPHSLNAFPVLNQDQSHQNETKVRWGRGCRGG